MAKFMGAISILAYFRFLSAFSLGLRVTLYTYIKLIYGIVTPCAPHSLTGLDTKAHPV